MSRPNCRTLIVVTWGMFFPSHALAYIDPGTSGMISQVLYVMLYGALAVFFYSFNHIKQHLAHLKQFLTKVFDRR